MLLDMMLLHLEIMPPRFSYHYLCWWKMLYNLLYPPSLIDWLIVVRRLRVIVICYHFHPLPSSSFVSAPLFFTSHCFVVVFLKIGSSRLNKIGRGEYCCLESHAIVDESTSVHDAADGRTWVRADAEYEL